MEAASGSSSLYLLLSYFVALLVAGITIVVWLWRQERQPAAVPAQQQPQQRRPRRGLQDMIERDQPQENVRQRPPQEPPKPSKYEEKMAAKEAARIAREEEEERARLAKIWAEKEQMDQEFEEWKHLIVEEEKGSLETDNAMSDENLLERFLEEILNRKIVAIEDLVAKFDMGSAQNCLDRIKFLEDNGRLSGIVDDRGKYIYVSPADLDQVAQFISDKGRVSIRDVVAACNRIIDVTSVNVVDKFDFDADDEQQEQIATS